MGILQAVTALRSCASSLAGQCSPTSSKGTELIDTSTTPSDPRPPKITPVVPYLLQTAAIIFQIVIDVQLAKFLGGRSFQAENNSDKYLFWAAAIVAVLCWFFIEKLLPTPREGWSFKGNSEKCPLSLSDLIQLDAAAKAKTPRGTPPTTRPANSTKNWTCRGGGHSDEHNDEDDSDNDDDDDDDDGLDIDGLSQGGDTPTPSQHTPTSATPNAASAIAARNHARQFDTHEIGKRATLKSF